MAWSLLLPIAPKARKKQINEWHIWKVLKIYGMTEKNERHGNALAYSGHYVVLGLCTLCCLFSLLEHIITLKF